MSISPFMKKMLEKKEKFDEEKKERSQFVKVDWFKPEEGEQKIRLLPHIKDLKAKEHKNDAIREVYLHYVGNGKGGFNVRCEEDLKSGSKCPFCEKSKKLYDAAGDDKDKKEKARQFRRSRKFLVNVLNYEEKKIQPWTFGQQIFDDLVEFLGGDYGNPLDLNDGRDWRLKKILDPKKGKLGVQYKITPIASESKIPDKAKTLLDEMTDVGTLYSESGLKAMKKFLGGDDEDEEEEEFDEKAKKKKSSDDEDWDDEKTTKAKKPKDDDEDDEESADDDDEGGWVTAGKDEAKTKKKPVVEEKKKKKKSEDEEDFDLDKLASDEEISEEELDEALA